MSSGQNRTAPMKMRCGMQLVNVCVTAKVCTCPLHVSFGVFVCVTTSVLVVAAPGMPHGSAGCSTCHVLTQIWTDSLK